MRNQSNEGTEFAFKKFHNRLQAAPRLVGRSSAGCNCKLHAAANHYLQNCIQQKNWMLAFDMKVGQLRQWDDDWISNCRNFDSVQANMPKSGASSILLMRFGRDLKSGGQLASLVVGGRAIVDVVRHSWPPIHAVRAIQGVAEEPQSVIASSIASIVEGRVITRTDQFDAGSPGV
jgi:hypothetical protein